MRFAETVTPGRCGISAKIFRSAGMHSCWTTLGSRLNRHGPLLHACRPIPARLHFPCLVPVNALDPSPDSQRNCCDTGGPGQHRCDNCTFNASGRRETSPFPIPEGWHPVGQGAGESGRAAPRKRKQVGSNDTSSRVGKRPVNPKQPSQNPRSASETGGADGNRVPVLRALPSVVLLLVLSPVMVAQHREKIPTRTADASGNRVHGC